MKTKYTPGPWRITRANYGCKTIKGRKGGTHKQAQYVTEVCSTPGLANEEEDAANARLIEQAPMMFEILQIIVEATEGMFFNNQPLSIAVAEARNLITKAK